MGGKFSDELESLPTDQWTGPILSAFGYHLVFITNRIAPQKPDLASVRAELLRDLEYEKQQELDQMIFEELKKKYDIEYELDPDKFDEAFIEFLKEGTGR